MTTNLRAAAERVKVLADEVRERATQQEDRRIRAKLRSNEADFRMCADAALLLSAIRDPMLAALLERLSGGPDA